MNRPLRSDLRTLALLIVISIAGLRSALAQYDPNHEAPRAADAPPSIYARVPTTLPPPSTADQTEGPQSLPVVRLPSTDGAHSPVPTVLPPPAVLSPPAVLPPPTLLPPVAAAPSSPATTTLWLISTRALPRPGGDGPSPEFAPEVQRYVYGRGWVPAPLEALVASPGAVTTIFVHGNDTNADMALRGGTGLYSQLVGNPTAPAPATRFIIWSWPNQATTLRVRKTTQASAGRLGIESYYLACLLRHVADQSPTSVVGYSSGSSVVGGALHILGGGTLEGRFLLSPPQPEASKIHAVMLGAAMPNDWLLPGMPYDRAWTQLSRLVVTVNPDDAVLHWYPLLWGRNGPVALGSTGVPDITRLGAWQAKLVQLDLRAVMHRNHGWKYYSTSPTITQILKQEMMTLPAAQQRGNVSLARQPR